MEVTELLKGAVGSVKSILDIDSVIGTPIKSDENIVIVPITKMSVGFVSLGGELEGKFSKDIKNMPIGGVGGGANISPLGFLVIDGDRVKFINIDKEEGGKWTEYANIVLDFLSR